MAGAAAGLNALYGEGAAEALAAKLDMTAVVANATRGVHGGGSEGTAVIDAFWTRKGATEPGIIVKAAFHQTWMVWWLVWVEPKLQRKGAYEVCWGLRELFASWGVTTMVCSPADLATEEFLLAHGFEWSTFEGDRRLVAATS